MLKKSNASKVLLQKCAGDTPLFDSRVERLSQSVHAGFITKDGDEIKDIKKYMEGGKLNGKN